MKIIIIIQITLDKQNHRGMTSVAYRLLENKDLFRQVFIRKIPDSTATKYLTRKQLIQKEFTTEKLM